ncbi:hypothetical protein ACSBOB_29375 [Mesorhizobium sp. ASY16-5R]|uniref:hypothetical protein n=1 Tax=Mesorhizobium sp. ASY16-5R TaxID=3445772 RepID=UPI003FA09288
MRKLFGSIFVAMLATPALANAPADIADLVGARAAGAESEIQARGYDNVNNNVWWNGATGTCVKVHVSNGKYSKIDTLKPSDCGQGGDAAGGGSSGDVPQAALNACSKRADEYQNAASGTSVVNGAERAGANWLLTMSTGTYTSKCTVTGSGKVVSIDPA